MGFGSFFCGFLVPTCFHFRAKIPIKSNKIPIPRGIQVLIDFWVDTLSDFRRQDEPKTRPRGRQDRQDGPKRPPRRPKRPPRRPQRGPRKTYTTCSWSVLAAKTPQDPSKTPQRLIFDQFLIDFLMVDFWLIFDSLFDRFLERFLLLFSLFLPLSLHHLHSSPLRGGLSNAVSPQ